MFKKKHPVCPVKIDVLCAGMATYDLYFTVDTHPLPDDKVFANTFLGCGGGPAANAAVAINRLGGKSAFAGYLGSDLFGAYHFREMETAGVLTDYIVRGQYPTRLAAIIVKPNGERTVVSYKGTAPQLTTNDLSLNLQAIQPGAVLCDGHEPEISLLLARQAKAAGIPVILDAGSLHPGTELLLPFTDYLVCSRKFAVAFCPGLEIREILEHLQQHCRQVIITLGADGVAWKNKDDQQLLPAFKVKAIDTTGAGDVFHGAFALGIARKRKLEENIRFAGAAAALCCTKLGARPGCPAAAEVNAFVKNHSPG